MCRARPAGLVLVALALAACGESGPEGAPRVRVAPILDSLFVDDTLPAGSFSATYFDAAGNARPPGAITWASSNPAVFTVDATGEVVGTGPGAALLSAQAQGVVGSAVLVVWRAVDVALLLDTIYLMPEDTLTVPVHVRVKSGAPATVWFRTPANPYFSVDSATGRDSAWVPGGRGDFYVLAATATDTAADTGTTEVVELTDTLDGKAYFTVLGSAIQRARAGARAVNYVRRDGNIGFRLSTPIEVDGSIVANVVVTLLDSVAASGTSAIDSLSPQEAFGAAFDAICRPIRPWALWAVAPSLYALSRSGTITVTRLDTVANGRAVGGRFAFTGQRTDLYDDPLGVLPVRGTFVAPLIADDGPCGS